MFGAQQAPSLHTSEGSYWGEQSKGEVQGWGGGRGEGARCSELRGSGGKGEVGWRWQRRNAKLNWKAFTHDANYATMFMTT